MFASPRQSGRAEARTETDTDEIIRRILLGVTVAKTDFRSVDEYIAAQPEAVRRILGGVRSTIRRALPEAEEVISYHYPRV